MFYIRLVIHIWSNHRYLLVLAPTRHRTWYHFYWHTNGSACISKFQIFCNKINAFSSFFLVSDIPRSIVVIELGSFSKKSTCHLWRLLHLSVQCYNCLQYWGTFPEVCKHRMQGTTAIHCLSATLSMFVLIRTPSGLHYNIFGLWLHKCCLDKSILLPGELNSHFSAHDFV